MNAATSATFCRFPRREIADPPRFVEPEPVDERGAASVSTEVRLMVEERAGGPVRIEAGVAGKVADAFAGTPERCIVGDVVAEQASATVRRPEESEERADRRRLSGPVRSEKAEHLAVLNGKGDVLDPPDVAVVLREAATLDGSHTGEETAW